MQAALVERHGPAAGGRETWVSLAFEEIWGRLPRAGACSRDECRPLGDFVD
jgi:hypothetical protein